MSEDGELLGWANPETGDDQEFKLTPVFPREPQKLLAECSPVSIALLPAPGPSDLASLCDPERHLRKLRENTFDEGIRLWMSAVGREPVAAFLPKPEPPALARRRRLDTLLRVRLAGQRGLDEAIGDLDEAAGSGRLDPITWFAVRDTAAVLRKEKLPAIDLPPLDGVPLDFDVLAVVDQRRVPAWRDIWRLARTMWVRLARATLARVGGAYTLVASRAYAAPADGAGIPADLAKLGLGGDDAIWIHCRKVPFADRLPITGVESFTLRARFEGGVTVRAEATFRDEAAAVAAKAEIEGWKTLDLEPVDLREADAKAIAPLKAFLSSLSVSVEGARLVAEASAPGQTPESLFAGVIELEALHAYDEEGEGEDD